MPTGDSGSPSGRQPQLPFEPHCPYPPTLAPGLRPLSLLKAHWVSDLLPGTCADLRGAGDRGHGQDAYRCISTVETSSSLAVAPCLHSHWSSEPPTQETRAADSRPTWGRQEVGEPVLRHVGKRERVQRLPADKTVLEGLPWQSSGLDFAFLCKGAGSILISHASSKTLKNIEQK